MDQKHKSHSLKLANMVVELRRADPEVLSDFANGLRLSTESIEDLYAKRRGGRPNLLEFLENVDIFGFEIQPWERRSGCWFVQTRHLP
jgi:hypothetical protein